MTFTKDLWLGLLVVMLSFCARVALSQTTKNKQQELNKPLKTNIIGKGFDWNISLTYAFNKKYIKP